MDHLCTTDPDIVTLHRFKGEFRLGAGDLGDKTSRLTFSAIVDTETTGLGASDTVIELAVQPFVFDRTTGQLLEVLEPLTQLQDPCRPLSQEIQDLTGLTDDMLRGKTIDWAKVTQRLEPCDFVIAHNARFDRPMVHRGYTAAGKKPPRKAWVCSMNDIDWKKDITHPPGVSLGALAAWHGFFFSAHRALDDCKATLHLLDLSNKLMSLARRAKEPSYIVYTDDKVFEQNGLLKDRRYVWDATKRGWWKQVATAEDAATEREWLRTVVYANRQDKGYSVTVSPEERFL